MDATVGHELLSFLDSFSEYHQIPMHLPDAKKTTFITPCRLYCYNVMPFGLKNVGTTYQRPVIKIFQPLLGNTIEAYIDDLLVKSKERFDHTKHLQEAFELFRRYDMKLNPLKCAFGVSSGKFLGFMVTQRGIESNHVQLKAVMDSQAPTFRKWVQQLTIRLAALRQFISHFINRLKPFFINLKGAKTAYWNKECDWALIVIKHYLTEPPILANPGVGDTFYLYLAVSEELVSTALFKEDETESRDQYSL